MPADVVAIGGGTSNDLLMRIKATTLNRPFVVAGVDEATALGAAILGGIGAGVYRDAADAIAALARAAGRAPTPDVASTTPTSQQVFQRHLAALRPLHQASTR